VFIQVFLGAGKKKVGKQVLAINSLLKKRYIEMSRVIGKGGFKAYVTAFDLWQNLS